jgi:hypothetical protein
MFKFEYEPPFRGAGGQIIKGNGGAVERIIKGKGAKQGASNKKEQRGNDRPDL